MAKSTFAGKSTDDTIRNYAEMLIDDLNSNLPENAGKHWEKAREIDNVLAKQIFGKEYSDRIGKAYHNCIMNGQLPELEDLYRKHDVVMEKELENIMSGNDNPFYQSDITREQCNSKFDFILNLVSIARTICPQSPDLCVAGAWLCVLERSAGEIPVGDLDTIPNKWPKRGNFKEGTGHLKKLGEELIDKALEINPDNPKALEARMKFALLEKSHEFFNIESEQREKEHEERMAAIEQNKSSCFIATAAYGTPFAEEIDVLRNWRDDFLEASYPGRAFIKAYYSLSPPVADNISESKGKRKIVRTALGPIVKILKDKYSD